MPQKTANEINATSQGVCSGVESGVSSVTLHGAGHGGRSQSGYKHHKRNGMSCEDPRCRHLQRLARSTNRDSSISADASLPRAVTIP